MELLAGAGGGGGNNQRALRNLLLQLTRERRPGDDDFDSRCLERARKLRGRATEGAVLDLLDHFTASCSNPMRGEESPVKAAQALQFGAEVKVSEISRHLSFEFPAIALLFYRSSFRNLRVTSTTSPRSCRTAAIGLSSSAS